MSRIEVVFIDLQCDGCKKKLGIHAPSTEIARKRAVASGWTAWRKVRTTKVYDACSHRCRPSLEYYCLTSVYSQHRI